MAAAACGGVKVLHRACDGAGNSCSRLSELTQQVDQLQQDKERLQGEVDKLQQVHNLGSMLHVSCNVYMDHAAADIAQHEGQNLSYTDVMSLQSAPSANHTACRSVLSQAALRHVHYSSHTPMHLVEPLTSCVHKPAHRPKPRCLLIVRS